MHGEENGKIEQKLKEKLRIYILQNKKRQGVEMEKELKSARILVNKIIKKLKRSDIDWTIQTSISSVEPDLIYYSCQIEAPANGLAPLTWVKTSWLELEKALKATAEHLSEEDIEIAYHKAEIERAQRRIDYHQEYLEKES